MINLIINKVQDITKLNYFTENDYVKAGNIDSLKITGMPAIPELNSCGLYVIVKPEKYEREFLTLEEVLRNGNVIRPWSNERLLEKWDDDTDILYNGIAGARSPRSLEARLGDLIRHCKGQTSYNGPHKGGEIIWQLKNYGCFEIWIFPMEFLKNPRESEISYLNAYLTKKGKLPFANKIN